MDNQLYQKRPPWLIAATVELFTPREFRQALTVDLLLTYTTLRQYLIRAVLNIRLMVADNAREAFDVRRHAGDVLSIIIAYCTYCWMTMSIGRLAAILAVAIPTLIWRDAHKHRKPSPWDPATDGFLVAATVLVSQSLLFPPPAESVNWMLWVSTAGGYAVLCKTWIEVKKINDRAYRELAANYANCAN